MYYIHKEDRDFIVMSTNYNTTPDYRVFSGIVIWSESTYKLGDKSSIWLKSHFEPVTLFFEETVTQKIKKELK